jgi:hypothetical protein
VTKRKKPTTPLQPPKKEPIPNLEAGTKEGLKKAIDDLIKNGVKD